MLTLRRKNGRCRQKIVWRGLVNHVGGGGVTIGVANRRSAINKLNRRGERGSPCWRPTLEEKGWPS